MFSYDHPVQANNRASKQSRAGRVVLVYWGHQHNSNGNVIKTRKRLCNCALLTITLLRSKRIFFRRKFEMKWKSIFTMQVAQATFWQIFNDFRYTNRLESTQECQSIIARLPPTPGNNKKDYFCSVVLHILLLDDLTTHSTADDEKRLDDQNFMTFRTTRMFNRRRKGKTYKHAVDWYTPHR